MITTEVDEDVLPGDRHSGGHVTASGLAFPKPPRQSPIPPVILVPAQDYRPALLNSSCSAGNRRWCSRNSAMKSVHAGSCDIWR